MNRIVLVGASGHGKVCAEVAELNGYTDIVFLDDDESIRCCGVHKVVGTSKDVNNYIVDDTDFFVSIGNAEHRSRIQQKIEDEGGNIVSLIHPKAIVSSNVSIGIGTVIMAGAVINCCTTIGKGVIINTSSSIDHDCIIGDYTHVAVGAHVCGTVKVGEKTWIGAGATVSNNVYICEGCVIGAGGVVIRNLEEKGTYVGVPVRQVYLS